MNFSNVYKGKRVLVTGHSGFKGSWLCSWLKEVGATVFGYSLAPVTEPNLFESLRLSDHVDSVFSDIRDYGALSIEINRVKPEIIFHLAAQPLVRQSYADPLETFSTNIMGTANILQAAQKSSTVKAVVVVTTDKVYSNKEWPWPYREQDSLGGDDPYSASKACAELVTHVYSSNLCKLNPEIAIATARGGNVVGGGDWSVDRLIPDIVRAVTAGKPIILRSPLAIRPWQHVLELCEGYLELGAILLSEEKSAREAWNFGPSSGNNLNVSELTKHFLKVFGKADHEILLQPASLKETQLLQLDISKSVQKLFWKPRLSATDTLAWTAEWYAKYYDDSSQVLAVTSKQLLSFIKLRESSLL